MSLRVPVHRLSTQGSTLCHSPPDVLQALAIREQGSYVCELKRVGRGHPVFHFDRWAVLSRAERMAGPTGGCRVGSGAGAERKRRDAGGVAGVTVIQRCRRRLPGKALSPIGHHQPLPPAV